MRQVSDNLIYTCLKGNNYTWRKCTTSNEGDPFRAPDSKSDFALRFSLETAAKITEIQFDFNQQNEPAQIGELEFEFGSESSYYYNVDNQCSLELTKSMSLMSETWKYKRDGVPFTGIS